jgi:hypothetical protein
MNGYLVNFAKAIIWFGTIFAFMQIFSLSTVAVSYRIEYLSVGLEMSRVESNSSELDSTR